MCVPNGHHLIVQFSVFLIMKHDFALLSFKYSPKKA